MTYSQIDSDRCTGKTTRFCMNVINEAMQKPHQPVTLRDHYVDHPTFSYKRNLRLNTINTVKAMIERLGLKGFQWSLNREGIPMLTFQPPSQEELLNILFNK